MNLVKPSFEVITPDCVRFNPDYGMSLLRFIEVVGRTCYKSEDKITASSAVKFCEMLRERGHWPMFDHVSLSVRFIVNRGFTHELVRHRLAGYAQESTRYCDYGKRGVAFIIPPWEPHIKSGEYKFDESRPNFNIDRKDSSIWFRGLLQAEEIYLERRKCGAKPEEARGSLPIDLKTEIVMTCNITEWRHVFKLRCSKKAHPQMRELMPLVRKTFQENVPVVFDGDNN